MPRNVLPGPSRSDSFCNQMQCKPIDFYIKLSHQNAFDLPQRLTKLGMNHPGLSTKTYEPETNGYSDDPGDYEVQPCFTPSYRRTLTFVILLLEHCKSTKRRCGDSESDSGPRLPFPQHIQILSTYQCTGRQTQRSAAPCFARSSRTGCCRAFASLHPSLSLSRLASTDTLRTSRATSEAL